MDKHECTICFLSVESDFQHVLRCGHIFHRACVGRWIEERGTCPNCRNWEVSAPLPVLDMWFPPSPQMAHEETRQERIAAISRIPVTDIRENRENQNTVTCFVGGAAFTCPIRDMDLVMQQAELTREQALVCLHRHDGDIVNAILEVYE